ncbi:MAG: chromosomal replication initiator protein DnaA [Anaerolineaceae bacterium]|nr:chromosomal replication initiator protein DnaA [Anaerolineaceae bacterium]
MVRRNENPTTHILNGAADSARTAWSTALTQMKGSMDRQTFSTLLGNAELLACEDGIFTVGMANGFTRDWAEQRLSGTLEKILTAITGDPQKVAFVVAQNWVSSHTQTETAKETDPAIIPQSSESAQTAIAAAPAKRPAAESILARFTFDNFVVSNNNNLACAAARAVAETPGTAYNPLFIYGGVGMGKTHLLHAIGNRLTGSGMNVVFASSEEFTSDFIRSIQNRDDETFREKYRSADVLLIDDIQFIIGKESTQEAFFHTFNKLYEMNKQIVITSDRAPKAMATLDERMRSRFEWGLTVDIQPADLETRIAILSAKAKYAGKQVPMDVLEQIARQVTSNIRELEGALNRVLAVSDLCGHSLDKELVRMSLTDMSSPKHSTSADEIIESVSGVFGVPVEKVMSRDRTKDVALTRQVIMYLMREEANVSLPQIGLAMGGRDHTTVIHACEKVASLLQTDNAFRSRVFRAKDMIFG